MNRIAVLSKENDEEALRYKNELVRLIEESDIFSLVSPAEAEVLVLLGGDGSLLHAVREYGDLNIPFIGINFGDQGFFMNDRVDPETLLTLLQNSGEDFSETKFKLLDVKFEGADGRKQRVFAFNECVLKNDEGQAVHLKIFIDGEELNRFSGDGVMISTAQGTTGYAINTLRAPAVHHDIPAYLVLPLEPQIAWWCRSLIFPIMLPYASTVEIEVQNPSKRRAYLDIDGKRYHDVIRVHVKASRRTIRVWKYKDPARARSYTSTLIDKIIGRPLK